jgi:hypothetical protein
MRQARKFVAASNERFVPSAERLVGENSRIVSLRFALSLKRILSNLRLCSYAASVGQGERSIVRCTGAASHTACCTGRPFSSPGSRLIDR